MLKFKSLAIGLFTAISIFPAAQAMAATGHASEIQQPDRELHAQVILKVGPQIRRDRVYYPQRRINRFYRQREWEREREVRARWESDRPRYRQYDRRYYPRPYRY
jgi:hypothetical protein